MEPYTGHCSSKTATITASAEGYAGNGPRRILFGTTNLERIVAIDARNHLWGYRCAANAVRHMNLLFSSAA